MLQIRNGTTQLRAICIGVAAVVVSAIAATGAAAAQSAPQSPAPGQSAAAAAPVARSTVLQNLEIASDLSSELAKFHRVPMPFDAKGMSAREHALIDKLVQACRYLDQIYWQQSDPEGYKLYVALRSDPSSEAQQVRRFLRINGSRYDLIRDNAPFVDRTPAPPGRNLYPADITRSEFERYVATHPAQKSALYDTQSVVRRQGNQLEAVPYHVAYAHWLKPMALLLREAADLSDDAAFARFLRLRADALLDDNYFESDLAWMDLDNPKIDVIFAPYETYLDALLGIKTSYGASVLVRNDVESHKLDIYRQYVPQIQEALPLSAADLPSKKGLRSPMEVMDAPFRAGDLRHGYQAVADNLPNDPRVHEQKGSKKIFFKNFMDARVKYVILPIGQRLMRPDQAAQVSAEGYLITTIMHEISHGLGPAFARVSDQKLDIRAAIGPTYAGLEEAKADIVGLYGLHWLSDHGVIARDKLDGYYVTHVADIMRTVRFGLAEAHSRAEMMEFNYLTGRGAIQYDPASARYHVDQARMPGAITELSRKLLEMEAMGDRARAEAWFSKYGAMPPELARSLAAAKDVPVDIDPEPQLADD
jgi:hypothetical protein